MARSAISAGSGRPCHPSRSSISKNPRPLRVRARITVGPVTAGRAGERLVDLAQVVPVDDDRVAAERLHPLGVRVQVPAQFGRAALAEAVHVDDRGEVAQVVVGGLVQRLPHRPLGRLDVSAQHPDPVRQLIEVPAGQGHPDPVRQPLAERAGGHVDPRQHRGGVTLQPRAEPPVPGHQLLVGDDARLEHRVQQRRRVPLGEDQVVVGRVVWPLPVVAQMPGQQHRHQVGGRHARRRMAGPGRGIRTGSNRPAAARRAHGCRPGPARSWRSPPTAGVRLLLAAADGEKPVVGRTVPRPLIASGVAGAGMRSATVVWGSRRGGCSSRIAPAPREVK